MDSVKIKISLVPGIQISYFLLFSKFQCTPSYKVLRNMFLWDKSKPRSINRASY